jgi:hypothetical protein
MAGITGEAPKQLGDAQWSFIKKIRGAIMKDHVGFFKANDWRIYDHLVDAMTAICFVVRRRPLSTLSTLSHWLYGCHISYFPTTHHLVRTARRMTMSISRKAGG